MDETGAKSINEDLRGHVHLFFEIQPVRVADDPADCSPDKRYSFTTTIAAYRQ